MALHPLIIYPKREIAISFTNVSNKVEAQYMANIVQLHA